MTQYDGSDCASSSSNAVKFIYDHVSGKDILPKEIRASVQTKRFRSVTDDINEDLETEFFDHKRLEYKKDTTDKFESIKKLVLSANHERKTHLTVLRQKDGTFGVKFLPATEAVQLFRVADLKFTVVDFRSGSKRLVYFKKYIKYGINIRDVKKFTSEQHRQFTEMSYKAYVDWLRPIIETGECRMILGHIRDKKSDKSKKHKKIKDDNNKVKKETEEKPKYIVKSRL